MRRIHALLVFVLFTFTFVESVRAEWIDNGVPIAVAGDYSAVNACVSDGAGGAIIVGTGYRNGTYDIFAQRIDGLGVPRWAVNGVVVSAAAFDQYNAVAVADGAGGVIVAWPDTRSGTNDVYVQRINAAGTALWTANGVGLCTATNEQLNLSIASDGAGGAIVAWQDLRTGTSWDVYARRVNSAGTPQWTANGVAVCALVGLSSNSPVLVEDGTGGVILAWTDGRSGNSDIYVQRLNASGAPQWAANGVAMCTAANTQAGARIVSDGAAGAIVAWEDARSGTYDMYVQRVLPGGTMAWTANGRPLCLATGIQSNSEIVSDGAGGAIVVWQDERIPADVNIYAQHVNSLGAPTWDYDGVAVCTAPLTQDPGALVSDGAGGAIVVWEDRRSGVDAYAQNITASGGMRWQYDGMPVCTAARDQYFPLAAPDGSGGVITAWTDDRSGIFGVYAQRVEPRYGYWGRPEPTVISAQDNPGDQGGKVILRWASSQRDRFDNPAISHYSVWRSTDFVMAAVERAASASGLVVQNPLDVPADFAGTALWERATANGPEYWEWIANQDAFYMTSYSLTAPTRQDSVAGNPATHYFKVVAHEYQYPQTRAWESGTVSTYSVDNLAPAAPLFLMAQRAGADVNLRWNRAVAPDLRDYSVYRATASGVTPVPVNLLASATDTLLVDTNAPVTTLYYIVTAVDIHDNQSPPSNEASVSAPTGVGDTPPIAALTVGPNHPNPFAGTTTLAIGLPGESDVAIEVFDVAGRRVRAQTLARQPAGWRSLVFDGRDDQGRMLPSGVYFYRVQTARETVTRKMVIAR